MQRKPTHYGVPSAVNTDTSERHLAPSPSSGTVWKVISDSHLTDSHEAQHSLGWGHYLKILRWSASNFIRR